MDGLWANVPLPQETQSRPDQDHHLADVDLAQYGTPGNLSGSSWVGTYAAFPTQTDIELPPSDYSLLDNPISAIPRGDYYQACPPQGYGMSWHTSSSTETLNQPLLSLTDWMLPQYPPDYLGPSPLAVTSISQISDPLAPNPSTAASAVQPNLPLATEPSIPGFSGTSLVPVLNPPGSHIHSEPIAPNTSHPACRETGSKAPRASQTKVTKSSGRIPDTLRVLKAKKGGQSCSNATAKHTWPERVIHLYLYRGHTAKEVAFEMLAIHGIDVGKEKTFGQRLAKLGKNKTDSKSFPGGQIPDPVRRRNAQKLPNKPTRRFSKEIFGIVTETARADKVKARVEDMCTRGELKDGRTRADLDRRLKSKRQSFSAGEMELRNSAMKRLGRGDQLEKQLGRRRRTAPTPRLLSPAVYAHQETLFHAIDGFVKGALGGGKKQRWTAATRQFEPPDGTTSPPGAWQAISGRCSSLAVVAGAEIYDRADLVFRRIFDGLQAAAQSRDPNFLLHFWTICHILANTTLPSQRRFTEFLYLKLFLLGFRSALSAGSPFFDMLDALLCVVIHSPKDTKPTLALSCWKATHVLGSIIGEEHALVLNMGAQCTKTWKSKFTVSQETVEGLYGPLIEGASGAGDKEEEIAILYDSLFATWRQGSSKEPPVDQLARLGEVAKEQCLRDLASQDGLRFGLAARALHFAMSMQASHVMELWKVPAKRAEGVVDLARSFRHLDEAIEVLRRGDFDCRVHALGLSQTLSKRYRAFYARAEACHSRESARRKSILKHLPKGTVAPRVGRQARWIHTRQYRIQGRDSHFQNLNSSLEAQLPMFLAARKE